MKPLEKHIGYWLRLISNQVSTRFAQELAQHDVSIAEWVVLSLLEEKSLSPALIADKIGMTRGAASKVIDKLFQKKAISRTESKEDRRYQEISLTPIGRELLPKLKHIANTNDELFFGFLKPSDKNKMLAQLREIARQNQLKNIPIQ